MEALRRKVSSVGRPGSSATAASLPAPSQGGTAAAEGSTGTRLQQYSGSVAGSTVGGMQYGGSAMGAVHNSGAVQMQYGGSRAVTGLRQLGSGASSVSSSYGAAAMGHEGVSHATQLQGLSQQQALSQQQQQYRQQLPQQLQSQQRKPHVHLHVHAAAGTPGQPNTSGSYSSSSISPQ